MPTALAMLGTVPASVLGSLSAATENLNAEVQRIISNVPAPPVQRDHNGRVVRDREGDLVESLIFDTATEDREYRYRTAVKLLDDAVGAHDDTRGES